MTSAVASFHHLRRAGSSLLAVAVAPGEEPQILHWGRDLGDLSEGDVTGLVHARTPVVSHSAHDAARHFGVAPQPAAGFAGRPAVAGYRVGGASGAVTPLFGSWTVASASDDSVTWSASDPESGLGLGTEIELLGSGLFRLRHTLTNVAAGDYVVAAVHAMLPLPSTATEVLDLTGRWCRERSPQRRQLAQGSWVRESRRGRSGHDATLFMLAGSPGFSFRTGEVWGVHVAWSGDHVTYAERLPEGDAHLGGGELLSPGEVVLADGESYRSPWLYATWSGDGIDGVGDRVHAWLRSRSMHPRTPRPVVLNTWEAVYMVHNLETLTRLADTAAEVGVERFVLDDGWFKGRDDDRRSLGDWTVDGRKWPRGLGPLIDHVTSLGMDFGLWVEPEMVNLDSDVVRAHPDWVLRGRDALPPTWRFQQVLDLQKPDAYAFIRNAMMALLDEYDIAYLKWDHNRDLTDVGHGGRSAVHGQTLALYALLDELRTAHPDVEIESCASGGGRIDLEILQRTDRVWTSDCNDALERQSIQRWTQLLVPPELMGAHVGATTAHTTHRSHRLEFRAVTALFGHFGVEWDLVSASQDERDELARWITFHKEHRALLHSGRVVRGDHPDPGIWVHGVVAGDGSEALFAVVGIASAQTSVPLTVRLPGLDADLRYRAEVLDVVPPLHGAYHGHSGLETGPAVLSGRVLESLGVAIPIVLPESTRLIRVVSV